MVSKKGRTFCISVQGGDEDTLMGKWVRSFFIDGRYSRGSAITKRVRWGWRAKAVILMYSKKIQCRSFCIHLILYYIKCVLEGGYFAELFFSTIIILFVSDNSSSLSLCHYFTID